MKLTQKILGYLNRVFDKDPHPVLAFRLQYDGSGMTWSVANGRLTTAVTGGSGVGLSIDFTQLSVAQLGAYLSVQPGYSVPYTDITAFSGLSALVLIDGVGDINASNGDHFYGYTSVLWAYIEAVGSELTLIRAAISEALLQMSANTASGEWVDVHGVYYNVLRNQGEADTQYAARIVAEVLQARGNNVVIGQALKTAVGATAVAVDDYRTVTVAGDGTKSYGLFDVTIDSTTDTEMAALQDALARQIIEAMRDAGTFLRKMKYIRRSPWLAYGGATTCSGETVTVSFRSMTFDGTWFLGGYEILNGFKSGTYLISDGSNKSDGSETSNGLKV